MKEEALKNRLKTWLRIFNEGTFPAKGQMLGFGKFEIQTPQECLMRIFELAEILNLQAKHIEDILIEGDKEIRKGRVEVAWPSQ